MSEALEQFLLQAPESMEQLIEEITPDIYANLKSAIELGKWNDGSRLSAEQLESCMQAVILYESKNLPQQQRTGFDLVANCSSKKAGSKKVGSGQAENEQSDPAGEIISFVEQSGPESQS